jgi:WD40 repeat protein
MRPVGPAMNAFDLALTPDGSAVAFMIYDAKGEPGEVRVWRASDEQTAPFPVSGRASSVAISPHAEYVVVCFGARPDAPAELSVYRADKPSAVASIRSEQSSLRATMNPKSNTIAVADGSTLTLRRLPGLEPMFTRNLAGKVQDVTFANSGEQLSIVDASGTISVLSTDGELQMSQHVFFQGSQRTSVAFSPDGNWLVALAEVSGRGVLHLLPVNRRALNSLLCAKLLQEPADAQWRLVLSDDRPPRACGTDVESRDR